MQYYSPFKNPNGEDIPFDDDDEWEKVAEYFDNELFSDIDYDEDGE